LLNRTVQKLGSSPVKKSLLAYMTTFGVDDWLFIINLEIALFLVMLLKIRGWVLVAIGLHFVLVMVTKLRPRLLECYVKHMRQAKRYWPGPTPLQRRFQVPKKFMEWSR